MCHGEQRSHADASGNKCEMHTTLIQWEIILRWGNFEDVVFVNLIMERLGATSAMFFSEHRYQVAVSF